MTFTTLLLCRIKALIAAQTQPSWKETCILHFFIETIFHKCMSPSQDGINTVQVSKEHLYVITANTLQHFPHHLLMHLKVLMGISFTFFSDISLADT